MVYITRHLCRTKRVIIFGEVQTVWRNDNYFTLRTHGRLSKKSAIRRAQAQRTDIERGYW